MVLNMVTKVLNVCSLEQEILKCLVAVFDKYADRELKRISEQFNLDNSDPARLGIISSSKEG